MAGGEQHARRNARLRQFHPESRFGGFTDIDGMVSFYSRVQELLPADGVALDVGCGRGNMADDPVRIRRELRTMRGKCKLVIGVDVDPAGADNESLDEFRLMEDTAHWPVDDASIDLMLADFVLEHVSDPDAFFSEAARVVKPGGHLCLRTVNRRSYLGLASRLIPSSRHDRMLGKAQPERASEDIFPTVYRCNTRRALAGALEQHDFDGVVYTTESEPNYLTFSGLAYALGLAHRRLAPKAIRLGLVSFARRS